MNWYIYSTLASFLVNLLLTIFIYARSRGKRDLILFGNLMAATTIWLLGAFMVNISSTPGAGLFWNRMLHIGSIMVIPTFFHFVWDFARKKTKKKKKRNLMVPLVYIISASLLFLVFNPQFIKSVLKIKYVGYYFEAGPLYGLFSALLAASAIYGSIQTYFIYKNSQGYKKQKAKFLLFALTMAAFSLLVFVIYVSSDQVKILPVNNLVAIIFSVSFTYAVLTHRIIDIKMVLAKVFMFLVYSIFFFGIYTLISSLLSWLLFEKIEYRHIITATVPFAVFVLLFRPLRKGLLEDIDRIVYGGEYEYRDLIKETSEALVAILDLRELLGYLTDTINVNLKPKKLSLFLKQGDNYAVKSSSSATSMRQKIFSKSELIKHLEKRKKPIMIWEFDKNKKKEKKIISALSRIHAEVILPLFFKDKLTGFIALDVKKTGKGYSSQDLEVLNAIASTAAVALQNARLYEEAITDGLTGLYHHKYFMHRINEELERAVRDNYPLSLIMMDIDFFKKINDKHGHQIGDQVLEELAALIKDNLRLFDIIARYGGEEFAILLPAMGKDTIKNHFKKATSIAERLRKSVENKKFSDDKIDVTISLGIAFFNGKGENFQPHDLIHEADEQLYLAKESGRNVVRKKDISTKKLA